MLKYLGRGKEVEEEREVQEWYSRQDGGSEQGRGGTYGELVE